VVSKRIGIILLFLLVIVLAACNQQPQIDEYEQVTFTDLLGRQVEIPADVDRVVAIGPGALRLYVYAGNTDYLVGIEEVEKGDVSGKPYMLANPRLADLPTVGLGGPNNSPDFEKLVTVAPDVIFSTYHSDASAADELQARTGIPVIVLSYGDTPLFGEDVNESLLLIGRVTGDEEQAQKIVAYIAQARQDLEARTKDIPEPEKPSVYVGGLGFKGAHGIESTQGRYALFDAIHAHNVADETRKVGAVMIDKEQLLIWNPEYIFIDMGGYMLVKDDYRENPGYYQALRAVTSGNVFSQMPYNFYSTNIDTALADVYYIGKTLYPEAFKDIDPVRKADEIYQTMLGVGLYERMAEKYGGFGRINLGD